MQEISEKEIVNSCIRYLVLNGYQVIRNNTGAFAVKGQNGKRRFIRFGFPGSADIIACSPSGRFVAVECKTRNGRLSDKQRDFLERIRSNGGIAIVARSLDDLICQLSRQGAAI